MKKILLSVALVAMSVFSMSALSFKVEVNGVEIKEGDEIELTELEPGTLPGDQCIIAHMVLTNLTSNDINASVLGVVDGFAQAPTATGNMAEMPQFCFDNCYPFMDEKLGEDGIWVTDGIFEAGGSCKFEPNQVRTGDKAHVEYRPAYEGMGFWDVQELYPGVSILKFTLKNNDDESDAISFNIKFNYKGNDAIDGIEADNAVAEYYNFQGMKVANPEKGGMYIVRRGAKVSKEIVR